jgi:hypothetical protein
LRYYIDGQNNSWRADLYWYFVQLAYKEKKKEEEEKLLG